MKGKVTELMGREKGKRKKLSSQLLILHFVEDLGDPVGNISEKLM